MSDTRRYPSIPPLTLATDLSASGLTIKTNTAVDWGNNAITTALFNTDYIPATLVNDTRTLVEFILIDATTIANLATTGATIYKRGLPYTATGADATDETEASARKLPWTQGETKLLIGTNPPWFYGSFPNRKNDELIIGTWTYSASAIPRLDAPGTWGVGTEEYFITKRYGDALSFAGAPDATTTQKGIFEKATAAEVVAGTEFGGTGATLAIDPAVLAAQIQSGSWVYGMEDGTGADDTYTVTLTPALTAYTTGQRLLIKITVANTGACTINFNGLGAKTIKKYATGALADLEDGDIVAGMGCLFWYDGTYMVLLNPNASMPSTALLQEMATFFGIFNGTGTEMNTLRAGATSDASALHVHAEFPTYMEISLNVSVGTLGDLNYVTLAYNEDGDETAGYMYYFQNSGPDGAGADNQTITGYRLVVDPLTKLPVWDGTSAASAISLTTNPGNITECFVAVGLDYVWVIAESVLYRYSADLQTRTTMTISGTVPTSDACRFGFTDDATLYIKTDTATELLVYTISGTTATRQSSLTLTSAVAGPTCWDGTNIYNYDGATGNIRKYSLAGGAASSTTLRWVVRETSNDLDATNNDAALINILVDGDYLIFVQTADATILAQTANTQRLTFRKISKP